MFKSEEREGIKNWRPIILLNVDYKIVSKILAERLKRVLQNIISTDQKGFVKDRNIFQGNRLLQDMIDYTEIEGEEGAIIFLDQQKAFDRAKWGWIDLCFEKCGFSDCFRGWVQMLLKNEKKKVFRRTDLYPASSPFHDQSVKDAQSFRFYTFCSIRRNPKIAGMSLPNRNGPSIESKVDMFADDIQEINKTEESTEETFKTLGIYEKASGAKLYLENNSGDAFSEMA